ncbi:hypothetical protein LCGC14_2826350 [marine sediment metagenome]|uniref:Uncharacterized protein n=1 Tax=marine sediment metagenome TaxID=412755 RepID=A0A0F8YFD8_9ZZZZ
MRNKKKAYRSSCLSPGVKRDALEHISKLTSWAALLDGAILGVLDRHGIE